MAAPDPLGDIDQLIAAAASGGGAAGMSPSTYTAGSYVTPQSPVWNVYMGHSAGSTLYANKQVDGEHNDASRLPPPRDQVMGTDQAYAQWYAWSDKQRQEWVDLLVKRGMLDKNDPDLYAKAAQGWSDAVQEAGNFYTLGGKKVTPWQVVDLYSGSGNGGNGGGPKTTTSTNTSTQHFDDLDARAAAEETYSQLLGRKSTAKENAALHKALNAYASAHPSISTTTSTTDASGNTTSNTTSKGGISSAGAQQIATDQARADGGYAEYQAATTNFNWLLQALGSTANV